MGKSFQICSLLSCQQLYVVNKRPLTKLWALLEIRIQIANRCTSWHCSFTGLRKGGYLKKISAPLSLINTYRMNLISTGSISLDSTFKDRNDVSYKIWKIFVAFANTNSAQALYSKVSRISCGRARRDLLISITLQPIYSFASKFVKGSIREKYIVKVTSRGLQKDVVYLCWLIAPSRIWAQMRRDWGSWVAGFSEMLCSSSESSWEKMWPSVGDPVLK
jgi:hypothetical protein